MLGVALSEVDGQVHPLAVLLLYLIPATEATKNKRNCNLASRCSSSSSIGKRDVHKDIVFVHDLVESVIASVYFMESVIVNVGHHHLVRHQRNAS